MKRTEAGGCARHVDFNMDRQNGEWEYMQFHSGYDFAMLPTDAEGIYELVVAVRPSFLPIHCTTDNPQCGRNEPAVITHTSPRGFATHDLWKEHPTQPGFWKMVGRAGAVTITLDGGKTNNATQGPCFSSV